ncbi:hypothetical protein NOK96_23150 [Vibrio parahaemolyticus]|nr:hypothetical protein [Vibrio parahaemolyticus]
MVVCGNLGIALLTP